MQTILPGSGISGSNRTLSKANMADAGAFSAAAWARAIAPGVVISVFKSLGKEGSTSCKSTKAVDKASLIQPNFTLPWDSKVKKRMFIFDGMVKCQPNNIDILSSFKFLSINILLHV
jgi:hypothetical protein